MISTLRSISLYFQLADLLREAIAPGTLPSGAALPTEAVLCAEHKLSRATVRQAPGLLQGKP